MGYSTRYSIKYSRWYSFSIHSIYYFYRGHQINYKIFYSRGHQIKYSTARSIGYFIRCPILYCVRYSSGTFLNGIRKGIVEDIL